jgi:hypothetical protein
MDRSGPAQGKLTVKGHLDFYLRRVQDDDSSLVTQQTDSIRVLLL